MLAIATFNKATSDERGLSVLAHYVKYADDDLFQDADGWERFNTTIAPVWAGELIRDVLAYVVDHAGGVDGVRAAIARLVELADIDEELEDQEGIATALKDAVPGKRLTQLEELVAAQGKVFEELAAHLGVRTGA
jgi:hypothetical protein